jgi:hypothetical protein
MTSKDLRILPYLCSKETKGVIYWREGVGWGVLGGLPIINMTNPIKKEHLLREYNLN